MECAPGVSSVSLLWTLHPPYITTDHRYFDQPPHIDTDVIDISIKVTTETVGEGESDSVREGLGREEESCQLARDSKSYAVSV